MWRSRLHIELCRDPFLKLRISTVIAPVPFTRIIVFYKNQRELSMACAAGPQYTEQKGDFAPKGEKTHDRFSHGLWSRPSCTAE